MSEFPMKEGAAVVRQLRSVYDDDVRFGRGYRAVLRRASTSDELLAEGAYWYLVSVAQVPEALRHRVAPVILCFSAAKMSNAKSFSLGRWLRHTIYEEVRDADLPQRAARFRRLLAVGQGERDQLAHHLRRLVQHAAVKSNTGVDWGVVGADVLFWGEGVRRRWAADFFAFGLRTNSQTEQEISHG